MGESIGLSGPGPDISSSYNSRPTVRAAIIISVLISLKFLSMYSPVHPRYASLIPEVLQMRKTSRVRNICNVAVLFILALSISLFGCNNNTPVEGRGNLNIIVSDQASKTVAYEPADGYPSAMSHYTVVVKDSGGETVGTSGYMALENGEGRFEVTNLITGSYTVNVSGYVQTAADEYTLIATGSETATVNASYANDLVVAIDTFDDAYTGNITVELTMPIDAIVNNTISGNLSWTLTAIDDSGMSFNGSETLTAIALVDWKHTLTIADKKVPAGRYLLTVTFDNGSSYSAIDAVIAYPGLPSTGVINLDSRKPSSYEFTVTDMIGDELKPAGDGVYSAESDSFVVTLSTTLGENETPLWFVDGMVVEVTDNGDVSYTLTGLDDGRRNVTMVVYDDGFKSVIGSLMFVVEIEAESDIGAVAPDEVTVEYYDLAKNLQLGDNEINMGFTKDGVDVEFPYTGAIVAKDITSGTSVTYEMLGLQPITRKFSEYFVEDEYKEGKYYIASEAKFGEIFSSHYLMLPPIVKDFDFFSYLLEFAYTRGNNSLNLKEIVTSISYDDMLNQADNGFAKLRDIVELEFNSDNIKNCDNQSFSIRSLSSEDSNALSFIHSPADTSEFNRFHRMYQDFAFGYMEFNPEMHSLDIFYIPQSVVEEYTHEGNQGLRLKAGFVSFDNLYLFSFCDPYFYESQEYPLLNVKDPLPEAVHISSALGHMESSDEATD